MLSWTQKALNFLIFLGCGLWLYLFMSSVSVAVVWCGLILLVTCGIHSGKYDKYGSLVVAKGCLSPTVKWPMQLPLLQVSMMSHIPQIHSPHSKLSVWVILFRLNTFTIHQSWIRREGDPIESNMAWAENRKLKTGIVSSRPKATSRNIDHSWRPEAPQRH